MSIPIPTIRTWTDYRFAVTEACRGCWDRTHGHTPAELYEDGYSDAVADCIAAIERIPLPPVPTV